MSLKNILKKGSIVAVGSALFLTLVPSQNILQTEIVYNLPKKSFCYSELKKQVEQESLSYKLKISLIGFEIINKTMNWYGTVTEDSEKLESKVDVFLRASEKYWGDLNMRKVDYKDAKNIEGICEEYSYRLSDGKKIMNGEVKIYADKAEILKDDKLIVKKGKYNGVLSFLEDIRSKDLKVGEMRSMDVLFGKDVYHFNYKVVCEETLYEQYVPVKDDSTGEWRNEGRGKSCKTYKIELKIRRQGADDVREGIYFWIGKEGEYEGDLVKAKVDYNWAITAEMILKNLF